MNRRRFVTIISASAVATPAVAVELPDWPFSRRTSRRPLLIAGSSGMVDLNAALVADFVKLYPDIDAVIESCSSLSALIALKRGSIDVAAIDRDVTEKEDEKGLRNYLIARNGIDIVVDRQSTIPVLTSSQVRGIFEGNIDNWAEVGGPDLAGPQSDRDGLRKIESSSPQNRRKNNRRSLEGYRKRLRPLHTRRMPELPQSSRICRRLIAR